MTTTNRAEQFGQKVAFVFKRTHFRLTTRLKKLGLSDALAKIILISLLIGALSIFVMSVFVVLSIIVVVIAGSIIFSLIRGGKTDSYTEYREKNKAKYRDGHSGYGFYHGNRRTDNYDTSED